MLRQYIRNADTDDSTYSQLLSGFAKLPRSKTSGTAPMQSKPQQNLCTGIEIPRHRTLRIKITRDEELTRAASKRRELRRRLHIDRQDRWLCSRGARLQVENQRLRNEQIEELFMYLDSDGSGAIDLDELKGPLLTIGLANSAAAVQRMIRTVSETDEVTLAQFKELLDKFSPQSPAQAPSWCPNVNPVSRGRASPRGKRQQHIEPKKNMLDELSKMGRGKRESQLAFPSHLLAQRRSTLFTAILGSPQTPGFHTAQSILNTILADMRADKQRASHH